MKRVLFALVACTCAALLAQGTSVPRGVYAQTENETFSVQSEEGPKFRHSRFHKLDYLFQKISKQDEATPADTETNYIEKSDSTKEQDKQRYVEDTNIDDDIFPDEYEDEDPKAEQKPQQDFFDDDYIEMIMLEDQALKEDYDQETEHNLQADATTTPTYRWRYYGTRRELKPAKPGVPKIKQSDLKEALDHAITMNKEGICKTPQKRIFYVKSIHPNPSKTYVPQCLFLYVCGDDTGCCKSASMTCAPKTIVTVHLAFYTKTIGQEQNLVEKLPFYNHTECECVSRNTDYMIKDENAAALSAKPLLGIQLPNAPAAITDVPIALKRCECPMEYVIHSLQDGECECDCSSRQRGCMRLKRGKEYFGLKDRICIQRRRCNIPLCEFGSYIEGAGRCPRRNETGYDQYRHLRSSRGK